MINKVAYIIDPIESLHVEKDSSIAIIKEAQSRGYLNYITTLDHLFLKNNEAFARLNKIIFSSTQSNDYSIEENVEISLGEFDVLFMRKDPPYNMRYLVATYIIERAQSNGTFIVNNPSSLRDLNEKIFASDFPDVCPPNIISSDKSEILRFLRTHQKIVAKPLDKMGGKSIYVIDEQDTNKHVILEDLIGKERAYITAQKYIPEITSSGDKRVILIDGEPIPFGLRRIATGDDHRGNLSAGATSEGFPLSDRDYKICKTIQSALKARGLMFVGIDIIGDYLTEINITSPTGIVEIDKAFRCNITSTLFDAIDKKINSKT